MLIDTHCHLDDERYDEDFDEMLNRAISNGVEKFIIPAADPLTLQKAIKIVDKYENIYFSVGVHPYDADNYNRDFIEQFINHKKCVAVGECGLDYYRLPEDKSKIDEYKEKQKKVFIDQIDLAKKYKKPIIVHIRDASDDSLNILLQENAKEVGGVLHCYNADHQLLKLANYGFYFGIGGVITFKNAKKLIEVYPLIPKDKLIIETDAPYLTPTPHRGKRNEPSYCNFISDKMSELSGVSRDEIDKLTTINAVKLFRI